MSKPIAIGTRYQRADEFAKVHDLIPDLDDDQLDALYLNADNLETQVELQTWHVRAHVIWEKRQRQRNRKDTTDTNAYLRGLGIGANRANKLARAWATFGDSVPAGTEWSLPARFYIEALGADDPRAALDEAQRRRAADPSYTSDDLARNIREAKLAAKRQAPSITVAAAEIVERLRSPVATAMRRLLAARQAVRPIERYLPVRVAVVVAEDIGWPVVVSMAQWLLQVEAARVGHDGPLRVPKRRATEVEPGSLLLSEQSSDTDEGEESRASA